MLFLFLALTVFAAEYNFHILGSTTPSANVVIRGENTSASSSMIHKTLDADLEGVFKADFQIETKGVYFFYIYAQKDGETTKTESFTIDVKPDMPTIISGVELLFPNKTNDTQENCERNSDFNSDGKVDLTDFSILLSKWNTFDCRADLDDSGRVGLEDLSVLFRDWTKK